MGRGVVATVDGHEVVVGSPRLLQERGIAVPDHGDDSTSGATAVHVAIDGSAAATFLVILSVRARPRPSPTCGPPAPRSGW